MKRNSFTKHYKHNPAKSVKQLTWFGIWNPVSNEHSAFKEVSKTPTQLESSDK